MFDASLVVLRLVLPIDQNVIHQTLDALETGQELTHPSLEVFRGT